MNLWARLHPPLREKATKSRDGIPEIAIVGSPNVGKSVIFNRLTGVYATVSNYPGTTVEVTRGKTKIGGREAKIVDTPGMYSLMPLSEEEAVARRLLLEEKPDIVLHVVDARNLRRMLPMTLQLLEAGFPVVLALNMMDESEELGFSYDLDELRRRLKIPVIATAASGGRGMQELANALAEKLENHKCEAPDCSSPPDDMKYDSSIEQAIRKIEKIIGSPLAIGPRALALLLLQEDEESFALIRQKVSADAEARARKIVEEIHSKYSQPLSIVLAMQRQAYANEIISRVVREPETLRPWKYEWLSRLLMRPASGIPFLLLVLYLGIYKFVGVFGAGTLVDLLDEKVFGEWINPPVTRFFESLLPPLWSNLFVGEYGIVTLGITYAVAIILPIVSLFFFVFAIMEDSGYLPRLAMLIDRVLKTIGLNGRAVIPLILGFGCDTMATLTTRVLETRRERIITTLLLALAIPCSAQSGLFLGMLSAVQPYGLLIYVTTLTIIFLLVGLLASKVMPGRKADFYIELPPLRMPRIGNVLSKTYSRLEWYLIEIIPLFILASVLLWLGSLSLEGDVVTFKPHQGIFGVLERLLDPLAALIGLPTMADVINRPEIGFSGGAILLSGFFRRDYGAAGLWNLFKSGILAPTQVIVAAVTLTLFLPCLAQFLVMKKERGFWTATAMAAFALFVAFGVGALLKAGLDASGLHLILNQAAIDAKGL